jgi:hypothetical protein
MRKLFNWSLVVIVLLAALVVLLLSASVYTYHTLTDETLIAELRFDETGDRQYLARLRTGDRCDERILPVFGDQWRVDADFLKWKYWAILFGLDSQYRLDRLEGRYRDAAEQNSAPNVAHELGSETALDVIAVAQMLGSWNFLIDATYGSSTYRDIDTANVYYVYRTQTGIITRFEPRPVPREGKPLEIDVNAACGAEPALWERVTTWTDDRVEGLLHVAN